MNTLSFSEHYPKITKMASGHLSLELSESISFEDFPAYALSVLSAIGGSLEERNDSVVMCIWDVMVDKKKYRLVYDDYPCGVSLESQSDESDRGIIQIQQMLEKHSQQ